MWLVRVCGSLPARSRGNNVGGITMEEYLFICYEKCGTCRKAKAFLDGHNINYKVRSIKDDRPTREELSRWHEASGIPLKKFFNTSGLLYKSLQLKDKLPQMTEDEMLDLLSGDGMLVKRPILVGEGTVLVGFREEEYSDLSGQ